jgi:hypothetical protein
VFNDHPAAGRLHGPAWRIVEREPEPPQQAAAVPNSVSLTSFPSRRGYAASGSGYTPPAAPTAIVAGCPSNP